MFDGRHDAPKLAAKISFYSAKSIADDTRNRHYTSISNDNIKTLKLRGSRRQSPL